MRQDKIQTSFVLQEPLDGTFYDNLFVHFAPEAPWYEQVAASTSNLPKVTFTKEDLMI